MAGLSMGEAIAQGIVQGLGQGYQGVLKQRREDQLMAKEDKKWEERFQKQNTAAMEMWTKQEQISAQTRAKEAEKSQAFQREERVAGYQQQLALENRRERFQTQHIAATAQEARRTAIFNTNLNYISQNLDKVQAFQTYGKMDVGQVANQLAVQSAKAAPAKLQQQVFQDTLKRLSGMSKQEMLGQAGLIPADLSPYLNDPQYKDVIPKGFMAGIQDPKLGMDQVFQFTPQQAAQEDPNALPKDVRMKLQREDAYKTALLSDPVFQQTPGYQFTSVDPAVLNILDTNLKGGQVSPEYTDQFGQLSTPLRDYVNRGLSGDNKSLMIVDGQLTTTAKAMARQQALEAVVAGSPVPQQGMQVPPMLQRPGAQGELPMTSQVPQAEQAGIPQAPMGELPMTSAEAKQQTMQDREASKGAKEIVKKVTDELVVLEDIDSLKQRMSTLSPEARAAMESVAFDEGGIVGDAMRVWRTKAQQDPAAKEAYDFMQYYQAMRNKYAHSQFGASQTAPEMANLLKVTGEGGWKGGAERLTTGLDALYNTGRSTLKGGMQGQSDEAVKAFLETSPIAAKALEQDQTYGTDLGKAKAELQTTSMNALQVMKPEVAKGVVMGLQAISKAGDMEAIQDSNRLLQMYAAGQVDDAMVQEWFKQLGAM